MRTLLLAAAAASVLATPALAGPPEIRCTQFGGYYPPVEDAWAALPPAVQAAVVRACGWDS